MHVHRGLKACALDKFTVNINQWRNAHWVGSVKKLKALDSQGPPSATAYRPEN
jgi:hypothetical protein